MGAISFRESSGTEPEDFVVACYTLPDCLLKGCTKFTLPLVVLFEKKHFHGNLPSLESGLCFPAGSLRRHTKRRLSDGCQEQGVSGWQSLQVPKP